LDYRWVSLRELPGGAFYHQAFQGYSGDRMAKFFSEEPGNFQRAAQSLHGIQLTGLGEYAYAFQPLPRLRLAAIFWPGDEEFAARGSILFDAASIHYMVLDGLTVLGSHLVSKLTKGPLEPFQAEKSAIPLVSSATRCSIPSRFCCCSGISVMTNTLSKNWLMTGIMGRNASINSIDGITGFRFGGFKAF
jgi:hypothetical protein